MSIEDYSLPFGDYFELEEQKGNGLSFPCCVCIHKVKTCNEEPCSKCGHNAGAEVQK